MSLMSSLQIPTNKLDFFIRSVDISSYIPGRVRLYSSKLKGNPGLAADIKSQLVYFNEIKTVEINIVTGSILITYEPAVLRTNPELKKVEEYIMTHVRRK